MPEFNIRTDAVDVEQIMRQIRARIREKRGVDYTEEQIQELASVKLEKFLDAKGVRSDLVEEFRRARGTAPPPPNYSFEDTTLYDSHRWTVRLIRRLLQPILKLLFNPNPLIHGLHLQSQINTIHAQRSHVREELDALYYEVVHNLVLETTRLGIEVKNLKMRVESLSSRLDFDERRGRALEGVVQYRPGTVTPRDYSRGQAGTPSGTPSASAPQGASTSAPGEDNQLAPGVRRRRRRRRGRRGHASKAVPEISASASRPDEREPAAPETTNRGSSVEPGGGEPTPDPFSSDQ